MTIFEHKEWGGWWTMSPNGSFTYLGSTSAEAPAPTICELCGERLVREGGRLVTVRSGDDGGTYDICEGNVRTDRDGNDSWGGHRLADVSAGS